MQASVAAHVPVAKIPIDLGLDSDFRSKRRHRSPSLRHVHDLPARALADHVCDSYSPVRSLDESTLAGLDSARLGRRLVGILKAKLNGAHALT